jgi:type IV secretory pathway VirB3-like protein
MVVAIMIVTILIIIIMMMMMMRIIVVVVMNIRIIANNDENSITGLAKDLCIIFLKKRHCKTNFTVISKY